MLENQTKTCVNCREIKESPEFNKNNRTSDGLYCYCKVCARAKFNEYYKNNKEKVNKKNNDDYQKNRLHVIERTRKNYFNNIEHRKKKRRESYVKNIKEHAEYRLKNSAKINEYMAKYRKTEIGRAIDKNKNHRRRSQKKQGDVTTKQLLELEQNAKTCYWCNCSLKKVKVHIDHYISLNCGGEHTLSNLVVSCQKCNLSKHAKDPLEFANSIGRLL